MLINPPVPSLLAGTAHHSMFQAAADPIFAIADELGPGTDINFRDAFAVLVSPTSHNQWDQSLPRFQNRDICLLGAGLIALRFARWRNA